METASAIITVKTQNEGAYIYPYKREDNMETDAVASKILIADDTKEVRDTIRMMLEREGYLIVGEAEDGGEAVSMAAELKPDLVIIDNLMHKMHGVEAIKLIKANNPNINIIMLTGVPSPSLVADCIKAGATNFLSKPIDRNHFLHIVKNICS
jgi:two-component system, chemotaxis family, chemotaxis protein CheY